MTALLSDFAEFSEKVRVRGTAKRKAHLRQKPKRDWRKIAALGALGVGAIAAAGYGGSRLLRKAGKLKQGSNVPRIIDIQDKAAPGDGLSFEFKDELRKRGIDSDVLKNPEQNSWKSRFYDEVANDQVEIEKRVRKLRGNNNPWKKVGEELVLGSVTYAPLAGLSYGLRIGGYEKQPIKNDRASLISRTLQGAALGSTTGFVGSGLLGANSWKRLALAGGLGGVAAGVGSYAGNKLTHDLPYLFSRSKRRKQ